LALVCKQPQTSGTRTEQGASGGRGHGRPLLHKNIEKHPFLGILRTLTILFGTPLALPRCTDCDALLSARKWPGEAGEDGE